MLCLAVALFCAAPTLAEEPGQHAKGGVNLGARVGNATGEGFVDFVLPLHSNGQSILFLNPRASLKDEGETELNLGLVARKKLPNTDVILGANAYLDRRESRRGNTFNQTGLGVEALSQWVDARLNYYRPNDDRVMIADAQMTDVDVDVSTSTSVSRRSDIETDTSLIDSTTSGGDPRFSGNSILTGGAVTENTLLNTNTTTTSTTTTTTRTIRTTTTDRFFEQFEQGREGWDAELMLKMPLPDRYPQTRLGVGYYDYSSGFNGGEGISGVKGRLEMRAGPFLTLDAEVFEDRELNDTSFFLGARLHLPFDMGRLVNGRNPFKNVKSRIRRHNQASFNERLDEMVIRDVRIQMEESEFLENRARKREDVEVEVETSSSTSISTTTEESVVTETSAEPTETITEQGEVVTVVHVDNDNSGDPDNDPGADGGTYENPHTDAASTNGDTTEADIILVHASSSITGAIQAGSNMRILGEGDDAVHVVDADQGQIALPETAPGAQSDARPTVEGVSISSQNVEVSNFTVNSGSISTAGGSTHSNIAIRRINSNGNASSSVINLGAGGSLDESITLNDINIAGHTGGSSAISIQNSLATAQVTGTGINVSGPGSNGLFLGGAAAGSSHAFSNVDISGTGGGINIVGSHGDYTFGDTGITDTNDAAFRIDGGTANIGFDAASSIAQGSNQSALGISGGHTGSLVFDGAITATNGDGLQFDDADGGYAFNGLVTLDGTANAADTGIDILNGSDGTFAFAGTTAITNDQGVAVNMTGSPGTAAFNSLDIDQSIGAGVQASDSGTLSLAGTIDGTGGDGINSANTDVVVNGVALGGDDQIGGDGINVANTADAIVAIDNATISDAAGAGIVVDGSGGGTTTVTSFSGNAVVNAGAGGVLFDTVTFDGTPGGGINQVAGGTMSIGSNHSAPGSGDRIQGDGLSFVDPSGDFNVATLNIANDTGTGLSVDTKSGGTTFNLVTGGGIIDTAGGPAMFLDPLTGNINLASVTSAGSTGNGIELDEFDGALTIGTTTIADPASDGIVVINDGAGAGPLNFGDTDITGLGAGTGVDLTQANGNITFNTLDITGTGAAGSKGIDLTGSSNAGTVMMNDTSNVQNVQFGVDLTDAAMTGMFQFGDGENSNDVLSIIDTSGVVDNKAVVIAGLDDSVGSYNFLDVDFANPPSGDSDTSNLAGPDVYWVDMEGDGDGSRSNPGSVTGANAATADAIVLVNTDSVANDDIDASDDGTQGADDSLILDPSQVLVSFNTIDIIDLADFGVAAGAPENVLLTGIVAESEVENPFTGFAPTLTTTGVNNTVALADNADIVGVNLANGGSGHALAGAGVGGTVTVSSLNVDSGGSGDDGVNITGGDANYTFSNLSVSNTGGDGIELNGTTGSFVFNDATTVTGTGGDGIKLDGNSGTVTFGGQVTVDTGASTAVNLVNNTGADINFNGGLDIDTTSGTGLNATGAGTVNVAASAGDESINSTGGQAVNLADVTVGATFDSIESAGAATGIGLDNVAGSFTVSGATRVDDATTAGISIANSSLNASFSGGTTILNDAAGADGHGVDLGTGAGGANTGIYSFAGLDITVNGVDAFGLRAQDSGTVNITDPNGDNQITSNNGTAILVNPTTVNAVFNSLTAGGGVNGISLTGMDGSLTVTGNVDIDGSSGDGIAINNSAATFDFGGTTGTTFVDNVGGDGIDLSGANGVVTFNAVDIDGVAGAGLAVANNTNAVTVSGGSIGATDDPGGIGVDVNGGGANVNVGATVTKTSAGDIVEVSGRTGGTVTLSGNLSATGGVANGIDVNNNNSGTTTFSGATKTLTTGANTAVNLATNGSHIINFTNGGLDIDTTTGTGFNATGGGTVNVTGTGNTVNTTTGTGVNIANATIGGNGVTFQSVSVNGASNGIVLDTTGSNGGFTVTGNGGTCTSASPGCSGGRIQSTSGADGAVAGNGVYLNNTGPVSLSFMRIDNHSNHAIFGDTVNGFSLIDSIVDGANGNNDAIDEGSIRFVNLLGSAAITRSDISGGHEDNLRIVNDTGTLDRLVISDSAFHDNSDDLGNDGILLESRNSAVMNVTVDNTSFSAHRGDHFDANATDSSSLDLVFTNNTMTGGHPNALGQTFLLSNGGSANVTFDVSGNSINDAILSAFTFFQSAASTASSSLVGTFSNNTIGTSGVTDSGSEQGSGVVFNATGDGSVTVDVNNNEIRQWANGQGLIILAGDGSPTVNATVTNNTIKEPGSFPQNGLHLNAGTTAAGIATVCLDIRGNDVVNSSSSFDEDFRLRQRNNSTVNLPGYTGGSSDTAAVVAFVQGNNTGAPTGSAAVSGSGGGFTGTGTACVLP